MIRLVISDMDGTIIGRDEQLPADIPELIDRLRGKGIQFTVATGRSEAFIEPLANQLKLSVPYIASNGASIVEKGVALRRKQFPISEIREIIELAQGLGMSLLFTSNGIDRIVESTPWLVKEAAKHHITYEPRPFSAYDWSNYLIEKVLIMDEIRDGRISTIEDLCKSIPSKSFGYVRYRNKAVELMEKTANKAEGILELLKLVDIPLSEVMVIGDDDNDLEMFKLGALSIAVGNASKNVLPYVDYHCEGTQFDGVKEAILKYCGV